MFVHKLHCKTFVKAVSDKLEFGLHSLHNPPKSTKSTQNLHTNQVLNTQQCAHSVSYQSYYYSANFQVAWLVEQQSAAELGSEFQIRCLEPGDLGNWETQEIIIESQFVLHTFDQLCIQLSQDLQQFRPGFRKLLGMNHNCWRDQYRTLFGFCGS